MAPKLYTRRGDDGHTDLFGGSRASKADLRVIAFGEVDELNSTLGLALTACDQHELVPILTDLQHRLFELGADLATPRSVGKTVRRIGHQDVTDLERTIDAVCEPLPQMRHFILPGGCELAARLHLARTVCRRAERACVALAATQPIGEEVVIFLNRLSDLLFAMSRRANQLANVPDVPWGKMNE